MPPKPSEFFRSMGPGSRTNITTPQLQQMQQEAERLEARAARADELERLQVFEPDVYGPGSGHSWFADIARVAKKTGDGDGGIEAAAKRLADSERYERRRSDQLVRRLQAEREIERALTRTPAEYAAYERWKDAGGAVFDRQEELRDLERRAASTTPGTGGYFTPPAWMVSEFVHAPRAGAPLAALWTRLPLPLKRGRSINLPRFAAGGGAGSAVQAADGAAVTIRDPADSTASAGIRTIAAILDSSMQLMDLSPVPFDDTFLADIREDFATQTDGQLLLGNNANGQLNGIIPGGTFSAANSLWLSSTNAATGQTWANGGTGIAASPHQMTAQLYAKLARYRGLPATHWVMNPDVWAVISGSADGSGRPLVTPGVTAKALHGLPVVEDENLVSSFGGTTAPSIGISAGVTSPTAGNGTYAPVLLGRWEDLVYFASEPEVEVMPDVLSSTLQVRFRVTQYIAAFPARVVWGGGNVAFAGTSQAGGLNTNAACSYGAFTQFQANGPLSPSTAGF